MIVELDYGNDKLKVEVPDKNLLGVLSSKPLPALPDASEALLEAIKNPIGSLPLKEKLLAGANRNAGTALKAPGILVNKNIPEKICIVISDSTRAAPTKMILEVLLPELESYGITRESITILIATGLHRPNIGKELEGLVGKEIADSYRIVNHNARDRESCIHIGNTKRGTPVIINKEYVGSDFRILTGLIEPHFMAGFSGGRKAICPGISYEDMFRHFHGPAILESPNSAFGILEGNPFHEESTEIAKMAGADFIINATINKHKEVTGVFCGDLEAAFHEGAKFCSDASICEIDREADIVITTGGGLPLDATLYQVVKGMVGAMPAVKQDGIIITAAECSEEIGSREFVEIVQEEADMDAFMEKIKRKDYFKIDQWEFEEYIKARRKAEICLYSGCLLASAYKIPEKTLILAKSVEDALAESLIKKGKDASIYVIPEGPYVIPYLKNRD